MRIALNFAGVLSVGTQVYATGLLPALGRLAPLDKFLVFLPPEVASFVSKDLPPNFEQRVIRNSSVLLRLLWEQTILPLHLRRWQADVLFSPMEFTPLVAPCPMLLAVHNPGPFLGPEFVPNSLANRVRRWLTRRSCKAAKRVVFVSQFSADFIGEKLNVPRRKRIVTYHGSDHSRWKLREDAATVLSRYALHQAPYILHVSQLRRFKRPDTLIRAFAAWTKSPERSSYNLVLTGTPDYEAAYGRELLDLVEGLGIQKQTHFLGHVPAADLPVLYQNAAVFVFPTSMETFGHPFIEAMASGAPMICADTAIAREICYDAALYFPVGDSQALANLLEEFLSASSEARLDLIRRGRERAGLFTFDREAAENLEALREIAICAEE